VTERAERTALYRFYDADGRLLYVGISNNPESRWKGHRYSIKRWPALVARRADEWFDSRTEAEAAEVAAIKDEKPRFNGAHNFTEGTFTAAIWSSSIVGQRKREEIIERIRREIASGNWSPGTRIPSATQIATFTKTSKSTTTKAIGPLIREGLLSVHGGRGVFVNPYAPDR